jgi:membrane-bound lytic murein transglycosylase MltF
MKPARRIIIALVTVSVLTILGFVFFRSSGGQIRDLEGIEKSGRIRIVTDGGSMGFSMTKDTVYGFQYEIIKRFADNLGLELQISKQNDLSKAIDELKDGEYDIVASLMPQTAGNQDEVTFTNSLMTSRLMLVQRKLPDSVSVKINKQYELAHDSIFITANPAYKARLKNLEQEIGDTIYVVDTEKYTTEQLIKLVAEGKLLYTVCPEELADKFLRMYPQLNISLPLGFSQNYGWIVNKKSVKLAEKLNSFLSDFIGSSAYWALYRKYY